MFWGSKMQAEAITTQRARVANPWLVWLWWTLATTVTGVLCFPVAEALGLPVVWGMTRSTAGGLPETIATGAIIGLAQGVLGVACTHPGGGTFRAGKAGHLPRPQPGVVWLHGHGGGPGSGCAHSYTYSFLLIRRDYRPPPGVALAQARHDS